MLTSLTSLLAASALSAATISFSDAQIVLNQAGSSASLLTSIGGNAADSILAMNIAGGGDTIITRDGRSILFSSGNSLTRNGVTASVAVPTGGQQQTVASNYSTNWSTMLDTSMVTAFQVSSMDPLVAPIVFNFSGLTIGDQYQAQFFFGQRNVARAFTVENGSNASNISGTITNSADTGRGGWYFTAEWTADATDQSLVFRPIGNQRAIINGVSLIAIPEPSSYAAIFGMLALAGVVLRRRRA